MLTGHAPPAGLRAARLVCAGLVLVVLVAALAGALTGSLAGPGADASSPGMVLADGAGMRAGAVLGLGLLAAALSGAGGRAGTVVLAVLPLLLGLLSLGGYGFVERIGPLEGGMAPATAGALVALGASLVLLAVVRHRAGALAAHVLVVLPATVGVLSLTGLAYAMEQLQGLRPHLPVTLHTGVALCLLSAGVLMSRPGDGWGRTVKDRPIARAALLQIGALSLLAPFLIGLVFVSGIRAGWFGDGVAPALTTLLLVMLLLWLSLRFAGVLGRAEEEVQRVGAVVRRQGEALERSRSRHLAMVEGLPQLVWTARPDGACDYLSPQWVRYTGIPEAGQLGLGWLGQVHPEDRDAVGAHWTGATEGRHEYDIEYRIRRHDGAYHWFKCRGTPVRDGLGRIEYWFGTCTDIQAIAEARDVLAQSRQVLEAEVEQRTVELMAVEAQLRQSQKMEAVGQLTGGLAHDFNNLLTGITGSLELLRTRIAQGRMGELDRYLDAAQASARRAAALTHRMLAFSRRQTLAPRPTDVNRLIAGMEELVRRTTGPSIAVAVEPGHGLWTALVDAGQLENALLNLCINARDAMPGGGQLRIRTENRSVDAAEAAARGMPEGEYVSLSVQDSGTGMSPEVIARAFDPFFTTKPIGEGTGLGLSMIYGFVRQSGGQVRLLSEPGCGTTACIELPRHDGMAEDGEQVPLPAPPHDGAGRTVLVVDDESVVRMLVGEVLGDMGYACIEAEDATAGLRRVHSPAAIDLLVTDVGLPGGINGRQMADAARLLRPGLKVLFITGYAESAVLNHGQLEPGMHVLTKPFTTDGLATKVKSVLEG